MQSFYTLDKDLHQQFLKYHKNKPIKYGTAGFREDASHINYIVFRVGVFVTTINKISPHLSLGVVISASHNKIQDNGVKITNFKGNMLQMHYQPILQKFIQQANLDLALTNLKTYLTQTKKFQLSQNPVYVLIGGDTRPSTRKLLDILTKGIQFQKGFAIDFGETTTPQLQYYVFYFNVILQKKYPTKTIKDYDIQQLRKYYWCNFTQYFLKSASYLNWTQLKHRSLDCSNGVGGKIIPQYCTLISKYLQIDLFNNNSPQLLNQKCGADYLKTQLKFPINYQKQQHNSFISFDGDADRIIFFIQSNSNIQLIDGDRQGTILTQFFKNISDTIQSQVTSFHQSTHLSLTIPINPTIGFVQTYYANSSSSQYLKKAYNMDPVYTATGVKHLHQKAQQYDIGIYFQSNGHGTVIFNKNYLDNLQLYLTNRKSYQTLSFCQDNQQILTKLISINQLIQFYVMSCKLANPSVGDAITNLLLFQIALHYLKMNYQSTLTLYHDLKCKTTKISVKNKQLLKVTEIQDRVLQPSSLQNSIDQILQKQHGKKAFLRASGTENLLRLHVEAQTNQQVQTITAAIVDVVNNCKELN